MFSRLQIIFVLLLFIGISNHVLILPHLLQAAKRDAWICVLIGYGLLLIWGVLLHFIIKRNKQKKLVDWVSERTGHAVAAVVILLFIIYIIFTAAITFYDFTQSVDIYFLPVTPIWLIVGPFLILCVLAAYQSLKTIVYLSSFFLPVVWILGHLVAFSTMGEKSYSYMLPVLMYGSEPLIKGTIIVLGGSVDLLFIVLLQHHLNKPFYLKHFIILISLLTGLVLGPTLGSIAAFGPNVAANMRFPAFEQWRLVMIGEHISHVDFLAVLQLLCGTTIRVSLCLFILYDILRKYTEKTKQMLLVLVGIILSAVSIYPISDIWMQTFLGRYFYPSVLIFGFLMTLFLLVISYLPRKKGGAQSL
ncbi:endospore germination permease [Alkalihalophilus marmarensis]|uniref:GerAB/ArcD/ProY family transporter n=1 Tax=Alkalihalophilus marmarensis TaxID=521377 RepID=UPI002E221419|nr:endospore germination permease [Alkalihalophilus marmarensis]